MATKSSLNRAFADLRKLGYIAKQGFMCCNGCAGNKLANDLAAKPEEARREVSGAVFYTKQEKDTLLERGEFYLSYGRIHVYEKGKSTAYGRPTVKVGKVVVETLTKYGIEVEWDGSPDQKILVKGIES